MATPLSPSVEALVVLLPNYSCWVLVWPAFPASAPPSAPCFLRVMSLQPGFDCPACSLSGMCQPWLPLECGGAELPHRFPNPERLIFADQLQMLRPQEKFSSGEMNSSASRGRTKLWGGRHDGSGILAGGRGGDGTSGLAWLCWDTSHFCHFWPEGSPC